MFTAQPTTEQNNKNYLLKELAPTIARYGNLPLVRYQFHSANNASHFGIMLVFCTMALWQPRVHCVELLFVTIVFRAFMSWERKIKTLKQSSKEGYNQWNYCNDVQRCRVLA